MELFYTSTENIALDSGSMIIDGDEFHHLVRVLRKKSGEEILVTDGNGLRCEARISDIGKSSLECEILAHCRVERPSTRVTVALSLLKAPQRFDLFLEKATELGVSSIIPMITVRTISQPSSEKVQAKLKPVEENVCVPSSMSVTARVVQPICFISRLRTDSALRTS